MASQTRNAIRKRYKRLVDRLLQSGYSEKGARRQIGRGLVADDQNVRGYAQEKSRQNAGVV